MKLIFERSASGRRTSLIPDIDVPETSPDFALRAAALPFIPQRESLSVTLHGDDRFPLVRLRYCCTVRVRLCAQYVFPFVIFQPVVYILILARAHIMHRLAVADSLPTSLAQVEYLPADAAQCVYLLAVQLRKVLLHRRLADAFNWLHKVGDVALYFHILFFIHFYTLAIFNIPNIFAIHIVYSVSIAHPTVILDFHLLTS